MTVPSAIYSVPGPSAIYSVPGPLTSLAGVPAPALETAATEPADLCWPVHLLVVQPDASHHAADQPASVRRSTPN